MSSYLTEFRDSNSTRKEIGENSEYDGMIDYRGFRGYYAHRSHGEWTAYLQWTHRTGHVVQEFSITAPTREALQKGVEMIIADFEEEDARRQLETMDVAKGIEKAMEAITAAVDRHKNDLENLERGHRREMGDIMESLETLKVEQARRDG